MEVIQHFLDLFLHVDQLLASLVTEYGAWVYGLLFLIVFCETGLVVFPLLPGDSLLFVAGTLAGASLLDAPILVATLMSAAILGDSTNYWIGRYIGGALLNKHDSRWIKREHLLKTHAFYEKHGGKTIIFARFLPIIRTFAPFVAGIGEMHYPRFLAFSVTGTVLWVSCFVSAGYFFGSIPLVRDNITLIALMVVVLSLTPAFLHFLRVRWRAKNKR